ncbi:MAG: 3-isopropylmalate dehydratase small subunit [Deltaproteobacteria bacterium]|nr:3-isopropylmalate dehydratase small subunit [Deltaproteobacteria bacterium]
MNIEGKVWKFGDNIDTDVIIPARFLNVSDKGELVKNCFTDLRPDFSKGVSQGDIIVGGNNFGCGSSREHAPLAIKESGIAAIVAKSFARIFYRNAFNIGLPILECREAVDPVKENDQIYLDLSTGEIVNRGSGERFSAKPIPDFMMQIIQAGGLVEYVRTQSINSSKSEVS